MWSATGVCLMLLLVHGKGSLGPDIRYPLYLILRCYNNHCPLTLENKLDSFKHLNASNHCFIMFPRKELSAKNADSKPTRHDKMKCCNKME